MSYWIFKCNPDKYRLDERLADPNPNITWRVTRYRKEIEPGDIAFVWKTGPDRGFRAVLKIESEPTETPEIESEQNYNVVHDSELCHRVHAKITNRSVNLPHTLLRTVTGLKWMSVFHGVQMGTNFPMTPAEGKIVLRLIARPRERILRTQ